MLIDVTNRNRLCREKNSYFSQLASWQGISEFTRAAIILLATGVGGMRVGV